MTGYEQYAFLVGGVDGKRDGHAREDDRIVERNKEQAGHQVFTFTRGLRNVSRSYHHAGETIVEYESEALRLSHGNNEALIRGQRLPRSLAVENAPGDEPPTDVLAAEEFGVPAPDSQIRRRVEPPSDVLAAEEFGVPAPDPAFRLRVEPPTDVLAAEEFGVPAPDPALRPEDLVLPSDLVGPEPRDVLAAEEFAMPAPDEAHVRPRTGLGGGRTAARGLAVAAALLSGGLLIRRQRRRAAQRRSLARRLLFRR
jgi:hypothetical protein